MERLTEYDYLAGIKTGDLKSGIDEQKRPEEGNL